MYFAFHVKKDALAAFINESQKEDSMGGNEIITIDKIDDTEYVVVIKRSFSYPYIINNLKQLYGVSLPFSG